MEHTPLIPEYFKLKYTALEISRRVGLLGASLQTWASDIAKQSGKDPVAVLVLRGGLYFFSDLVRAVNSSLEIMTITASSYSDSKNAAQSEVKLRGEFSLIRGRAVLLVDEICDSGKTLKAARERCLFEGASSVRTAVLIRRKLTSPALTPDYFAFEHEGSEWFVGYGMKDKNRWRNLPDIYVIKSPLDS